MSWSFGQTSPGPAFRSLPSPPSSSADLNCNSSGDFSILQDPDKKSHRPGHTWISTHLFLAAGACWGVLLQLWKHSRPPVPRCPIFAFYSQCFCAKSLSHVPDRKPWPNKRSHFCYPRKYHISVHFSKNAKGWQLSTRSGWSGNISNSIS